MKYCSSCKHIVNSDAQQCDLCSGAVADISPESAVCVVTVKGRMISLLENPLKDVGIPCSFVKTEGDVYNELNAKVNAESDFDLLVPFEYYRKAFDVCLGLGFVSPEDRLVPESEDTSSAPTQTYEEKFEQKNGVKHRTWQMIWMILFIIAACLVIWGIDFVAHYFNPYLT
ncbi:MAG: hypothetical protein IJ298_08140 [Ruminococcus sp.]|nr:hypothetical protein [Ruminococcus sp.]